MFYFFCSCHNNRLEQKETILKRLAIIILSIFILLIFLACPNPADPIPKKYSLTYNANGADTGSVPNDSNIYFEGSNATVQNNTGILEKSGNSFIGWTTGINGTGSRYNPGESLAIGSNNVILYALWTSAQVYTVTYDGNGNESGDVPTSTTNYEDGSLVTVFGNSGDLYKTGYIFNSWNSNSLGSRDSYTADDTFTITENITLFAQYIPLVTYTITYYGDDRDGGTVPSDSTSYEEGASVTAISAGTMTKTDLAFKGWNTEFGGGGTSYYPGEAFSMGTISLELFAQWESYNSLVTVPGGSFTQFDYIGPVSFSNTISSFEIGKYELTYDLWSEVRNWAELPVNGYNFRNSGREGDDGIDGEAATADKYEPVTWIDWRDAVVWCNAYSEMNSLTPVYYTDETFSAIIRNSDSNDVDSAVAAWNVEGYRLPTEGEFQYAARYQDGTNWTPYNYASGAGAYYDDNPSSELVAWYKGDNNNAAGHTHITGTTPHVNQLGISDMSGNVFELCWDWKDDYPPSGQTNYRGPESGTSRVRTGGSWDQLDVSLQTGSRSVATVSAEYHDTGLRVARSIAPANVYSITYNKHGADSGTVPENNNSYENGDTVLVSSEDDLGLTGSTFTGWNTTENGSGDQYYPGDTFSIGSVDITLYAQWSTTTYTVTYNGNGFDGGSVPVDSNNYADGASVEVLDDTGSLTRDNFTFTGWKTASGDGGSAEYQPGDSITITSGTILYAHWEADPTWSITYTANGADSGTVPTDATNYHEDDSAGVSGNTGNLARIHYNFIGWNTVGDGSGSVSGTTVGASIIIGTSDVSLYAEWEEIPTYTIIYNANGGSSAPSDSTLYEEGDEVTILAAGSITNGSETFIGWNSVSGGTGTGYNEGDFFTMGTSNRTLYAQWTSAATYAVSYDGNGSDGGSVPSGSNNYPEGDTVTVLGNTGSLTISGYNFAGWKTSSGGNSADYNADDTFTMGTSPVTLYAHWETLDVLVSVTGGTFTQEDPMGNSFSHTVSHFSIGKYEVTYDLWYTVHDWSKNNGYTFANSGKEGNDGIEGAAPTAEKYEPVTAINWRDAMIWCNAYSEKEGLTPVYYTDSAKTIPIRTSSNESSIDTAAGSYDNPYVNWSANGYRLPTEGEWQYAASYIDGTSWLEKDHASGDTSGYCDSGTGTASTIYGDYAWYKGNAGSSTHVVGQKLPNQLGIYDMSGNVNEIIWDWYANRYSDITSETDYRGPSTGTHRVKRGGGYYVDNPRRLRVGDRQQQEPHQGGNNSRNNGFRIVRSTEAL